jgi:hypothetical protein
MQQESNYEHAEMGQASTQTHACKVDTFLP